MTLEEVIADQQARLRRIHTYDPARAAVLTTYDNYATRAYSALGIGPRRGRVAVFINAPEGSGIPDGPCRPVAIVEDDDEAERLIRGRCAALEGLL